MAPDPKPTIVRRIPTEPTCIIAVCGCRYKVFTKRFEGARDEGVLTLDAPCAEHAAQGMVSCQQEASPVHRRRGSGWGTAPTRQ